VVRVVQIRAQNPGPLTLEGTNSYVVSDAMGAWVVDPGPALGEHLDALAESLAAVRVPWRGVLLTHDHADHADGVDGLLDRAGPVPVHGAGAAADVRVGDGDVIGPLTAVATPGHSPDHLAWLAGPELFSGDAVLGRGSVFLWPSPGALRGYLAALESLRAAPIARIHPGHGPRVEDAHAKLTEYLLHRADREERLVAALAAGRCTVDELLDAAWSEVAEPLRPAAAVTLAAHLDKLDEEGRLPAHVERIAVGAVPSWRQGA